MSTQTVFIVDDDPALRKSLRWLTESVGLRVETFATAEDFRAAYDPARSGCLVLDVRMPGMSGLDLQAYLVEQNIALPVLIVTGHAEVQSAVRAMKAGAVGFLEKPFGDQELLDHVQEALAIDQRERERKINLRDVRERYERLTPREREVMVLIARGRANKQIAAELDISQKTVEVHRAHVMKKLEAASIAGLVRMVLALEHGSVLADSPPEQ